MWKVKYKRKLEQWQRRTWIHLQSHFQVSQQPSETFVTRFLGQVGIIGSGQTTGVNSIVPFLQILLKQSSVHFSSQLQALFLLRSSHIHGISDKYNSIGK